MRELYTTKKPMLAGMLSLTHVWVLLVKVFTTTAITKLQSLATVLLEQVLMYPPVAIFVL